MIELNEVKFYVTVFGNLKWSLQYLMFMISWPIPIHCLMVLKIFSFNSHEHHWTSYAGTGTARTQKLRKKNINYQCDSAVSIWKECNLIDITRIQPQIPDSVFRPKFTATSCANCVLTQSFHILWLCLHSNKNLHFRRPDQSMQWIYVEPGQRRRSTRVSTNPPWISTGTYVGVLESLSIFCHQSRYHPSMDTQLSVFLLCYVASLVVVCPCNSQPAREPDRHHRTHPVIYGQYIWCKRTAV